MAIVNDLEIRRFTLSTDSSSHWARHFLRGSVLLYRMFWYEWMLYQIWYVIHDTIHCIPSQADSVEWLFCSDMMGNRAIYALHLACNHLTGKILNQLSWLEVRIEFLVITYRNFYIIVFALTLCYLRKSPLYPRSVKNWWAKVVSV